MDDDLVELQAGAWALWRSVALRAAGFPVDGLDRLGGDDEGARLAELDGDAAFREALTWQNRDALRNALDRLRPPVPAPPSRHRQRVETVASYWQRYCAKNDTIGFFGPLGWGDVVDDGPAAVVEPGSGLVAQRVTRFEVWAMEALADAIAADPDVRRWIPPRRRPDRVAGPLDLDEAEAYARCDGRPAFEVGPPELLDKLVAAELIVWAFKVPVGPHPERPLRAQLEAIGDDHVRDRCIGALDRLEQARDRVAAAAGDPDALAAALDELDATFETITGRASHRRAGEMYAGRSLCYEDCRRDVTVRFGPALVDELARVLVPVLAGSRWFCGEVAAIGRAIIGDVVTQVRTVRGETRVPLLDVWRGVTPRLMRFGARREMLAPLPEVEEVAAELQRRWAQLVAGDLDRLAERATDLFADSRPAWPRAVFHSPDVQLAASDVDAVNRGDFLLVVGDFHPGTITVVQSVFLEQHPDPDEVRRFVARHMPEPRLNAVPPRNIGRMGGRVFPGHALPGDVNLLTTDETCMPDGYRCVDLVDAWVDDRDGEPMVVAGDGSPLGTLLSAFEHLVFLNAVRSYVPFVPEPHAPRITAGRSVLRRETWTLDAATIDWAQQPRTETTHAAARRWAHSLGMPRRVFALVSDEPKPIYVDFESPALVNILARQVRGDGDARSVRITEMLPDPAHAWLTDRDGRRYTSELRLVAVDLALPAVRTR